MALKEQVPHVYGVGLRNVGSYQVSGTPWVTGSAIDVNKSQRHTFANVSKSFTVINTGSAEILVHFAHDSSNAEISGDGDTNAVTFVTSHDWYANDHYISVGSNGSVTFDVKCKNVFITNKSSSAGVGGYQIFAELTNIATGRMYHLTGSGITS